MTRDKAIEILIKAIPNPQWIEDIEMLDDCNTIKFKWNGERFSYDYEHMLIDCDKDGVITNNNASVLMTQLIGLKHSEIEKENN